MIVTKIVCGFGNQLFCYAMGYAMTRRLNLDAEDDLTLDCLSYDRKYDRTMFLDQMNIKGKIVYSEAPKCIRFLIRKKLEIGKQLIEEEKEWRKKYNKEYIVLNDDLYLRGYWQHHYYFDEYKDELKSMFQLRYESIQFKNTLQKYHYDNVTSVHIRRGDYVNLGMCLGMEYYRKAIDTIKSFAPSTNLLVFSDDINWARDNLSTLGIEADYFDNEYGISDIEEFFLMSKCDNHIVANSTFSWWAAYLHAGAENVVICPSNWLFDSAPEGWIEL